MARTGIDREELSVLAEIGALNAFGHTRREALWQVERAIRPTGELFEGEDEDVHGGQACPLSRRCRAVERVVADYEGTGPDDRAAPDGDAPARR